MACGDMTIEKELKECQVAEHETVGLTHRVGHFMADSIWQGKNLYPL